jgi:acetyl esterase/lipase
MLSLSRWLGPLTSATAVPRAVRRARVRVEGPREPFDAWVYEPRSAPARGALLVLPGLHYLGPADPRLDRFNRILAAAGVRVLSPFLPTFARLHVGPALGPDAVAAYDALADLADHARGGPRPGVFSISTGSLPAARVCAARAPAGWVAFGGYRDFAACVRFSLTNGGGGVPADPLNRPVVYLNLLPFMADRPPDPVPLERALRRYVEQTWGRPEMKSGGAWRVVSDRVERELEGSSRAVFRRATGADDPDGEVGLAALREAGDAFDCMDPAVGLARYDGLSVVVHGRDDDVVPLSEAYALHELLRAGGGDARLFLTGMYGHTGAAGFALADAGRELRSMLGIVEGIAQSAVPRSARLNRKRDAWGLG